MVSSSDNSDLWWLYSNFSTETWQNQHYFTVKCKNCKRTIQLILSLPEYDERMIKEYNIKEYHVNCLFQLFIPSFFIDLFCIMRTILPSIIQMSRVKDNRRQIFFNRSISWIHGLRISEVSWKVWMWAAFLFLRRFFWFDSWWSHLVCMSVPKRGIFVYLPTLSQIATRVREKWSNTKEGSIFETQWAVI